MLSDCCKTDRTAYDVRYTGKLSNRFQIYKLTNGWYARCVETARNTVVTFSPVQCTLTLRAAMHSVTDRRTDRWSIWWCH